MTLVGNKRISVSVPARFSRPSEGSDLFQPKFYRRSKGSDFFQQQRLCHCNHFDRERELSQNLNPLARIRDHHHSLGR
ncbi:MAG: hypothetical protein AUH36_01835 [Chloroflexi bacterium 13_1_40CM_55_7]|nr:MAG: hypothetical protein AUH36_01835 [Chloroflexi bacterium 13_1_40CM_55_7]